MFNLEANVRYTSKNIVQSNFFSCNFNNIENRLFISMDKKYISLNIKKNLKKLITFKL